MSIKSKTTTPQAATKATTTKAATKPKAKPKAKPRSKKRELLKVGQSYLIRTVTMAWAGKVVGKSTLGKETFIHLDTASWVADTGRFNEAASVGTEALSEVEVVPSGADVNVGAIVDIIPWVGPLPTSTK